MGKDSFKESDGLEFESKTWNRKMNKCRKVQKKKNRLCALFDKNRSKYMACKIRKPMVSNKYNLTIDKLKKYRVADRALVKEPIFWRNNVVQAWCISGSAGTDKDRRFGTDNEFWIGIYDEDAKAYAGKFRFYFTSYGGMCGYAFNEFFNERDIEYENDLLVQEMFLEKINTLIDSGIIALEGKS